MNFNCLMHGVGLCLVPLADELLLKVAVPPWLAVITQGDVGAELVAAVERDDGGAMLQQGGKCVDAHLALLSACTAHESWLTCCWSLYCAFRAASLSALALNINRKHATNAIIVIAQINSHGA